MPKLQIPIRIWYFHREVRDVNGSATIIVVYDGSEDGYASVQDQGFDETLADSTLQSVYSITFKLELVTRWTERIAVQQPSEMEIQFLNEVPEPMLPSRPPHPNRWRIINRTNTPDDVNNRRRFVRMEIERWRDPMNLL